MSDRAVENIVEDSLRRVLSSVMSDDDKRQMAARLYRFQALFDTSDTTGRLEGELAAIGFASSHVRPDKELPLLPMIAAIMRIASSQDDDRLLYDWLALLVRSIADSEAEHYIPRTLVELNQDADARFIRQLAEERNLAKAKLKSRSLRLETWSALKPDGKPESVPEIERRAILRFFADTRTPLDKQITAHHKAVRALTAEPSKTFLQLPDLGILPNELSFVKTQESDEELRLIFALDPAPQRSDNSFYFAITHDLSTDSIDGEFWIISADICRWQGRASTTSGPVHICETYSGLVDDIPSRAPFPGRGWRFGAQQSRSVLLRRMSEFFSFWDERHRLLSFHAGSLGAFLMDRGREDVMANFEFDFFRNNIELMFALACAHLERGLDIDPDVQAIAARLTTIRLKNSAYMSAWRDGLVRLQAGEVWFPDSLVLSLIKPDLVV